ncbi:MAG: MarR family transcriptional regulator [Phycisphaerales bacterium]|nr:MarR family transcriptional regulator [Phycisphaerales bacterium]
MWFMRIHMRSGRGKGLSVSQFRTLVRAERKGTLSDVAGCLGTTLPTASRIVSGLVTKGYLRRDESASDRRCCYLSLTPQGQRILKDAYAVTRDAMEAELKQLSDVDCRGISESLRLMGNVFAAGANV